jgi:hypothetical protein
MNIPLGRDVFQAVGLCVCPYFIVVQTNPKLSKSLPRDSLRDMFHGTLPYTRKDSRDSTLSGPLYSPSSDTTMSPQFKSWSASNWCDNTLPIVASRCPGLLSVSSQILAPSRHYVAIEPLPRSVSPPIPSSKIRLDQSLPLLPCPPGDPPGVSKPPGGAHSGQP